MRVASILSSLVTIASSEASFDANWSPHISAESDPLTAASHQLDWIGDNWKRNKKKNREERDEERVEERGEERKKTRKKNSDDNNDKQKKKRRKKENQDAGNRNEMKKKNQDAGNRNKMIKKRTQKRQKKKDRGDNVKNTRDVNQPAQFVTLSPTRSPSSKPTRSPSSRPTPLPSSRTTRPPNPAPRLVTPSPTRSPSTKPTESPSPRPKPRNEREAKNQIAESRNEREKKRRQKRQKQQDRGDKVKNTGGVNQPARFVTRRPTRLPSSQPTKSPSSRPTPSPLSRPTGTAFAQLLSKLPRPYPHTRFTHWGRLDAYEKDIGKLLGYDQNTWNNLDSNELEKDTFGKLTADQQDGATSLGMEGFTWDCYINHFTALSWDGLRAAGVAQYYEALGWGEASWNEGEDLPETEDMHWEELSPDQQEAAYKLCYFKNTWDWISLDEWRGSL